MTMHVTLTSLDQLRFTTAQLRERLHDEAKLRGGLDDVRVPRRAQLSSLVTARTQALPPTVPSPGPS